MSKRPTFLKRKFLINKGFQLPFMGRMILINLLLMSAIFVVNYFIFSRFNILGDILNLESEHYFYRFVNDQITLMTLIFIVVAICSTATMVLYGLFLSHRIAGPLENIKLRFKKMEQAKTIEELNELEKTEFRENDFFKEFAEAYNSHLDNIQNLKEKKRSLELVKDEDFENSKDKAA